MSTNRTTTRQTGTWTWDIRANNAVRRRSLSTRIGPTRRGMWGRLSPTFPINDTEGIPTRRTRSHSTATASPSVPLTCEGLRCGRWTVRLVAGEASAHQCHDCYWRSHVNNVSAVVLPTNGVILIIISTHINKQKKLNPISPSKIFFFCFRQ